MENDIFKCELCEYLTTNKSNYNKHMKSRRHADKFKQEQDDDKYICKYCNKQFSKYYNLSRHDAICLTKIKEMEAKLLEYRHLMKMAELEIELKYANQKISDLENNITYKISVKNYVQQNYPEAPALLPLPDYSAITYDEDTEVVDDDFISTLVYNYNNNCLHKYFGDFIIKYYRTEDPSQQSVWSSDISRLTYVVKELLSNNKSIWNHDYKGVKTKEYIVLPLLNYIKLYIDKFWIDNLDSFKHFKGANTLGKLQNTYNTIYKIKNDIESDVLSNDIIRYIAPYFRINRDDKLINV